MEAGKRVFAIGGESVYAVVFDQLREYIASVVTTQVNCDLPATQNDQTIRRFKECWLEGFSPDLTTKTYVHGEVTYNHVLWTRST